MKILLYPDKQQLLQKLARPYISNSEVSQQVSAIRVSVAQRGDDALRELSERFDGIALPDMRVPASAFYEAEKALSPALKEAINRAAANIEKFHRTQMQPFIQTMVEEGVTCWQRSVPVGRVGMYVPGGSAPLISTVLMLAIPARIANCPERVMCTPPDKNGNLDPAILYAAQLSGITRVFKVGGAQAIAAMTYGTQTIPRVDKVFGPGNQYVTEAKQQALAQGVAIDMPAGPSEVLIIADKTANPAFVAADLLAQAEHGADSQSVLLTNDRILLEAVQEQVKQQLEDLPRKGVAGMALRNSVMVLVKDMQEAMVISNDYAPEHLILAVANAEEMSMEVRQAGSVFLGNYTPESVGDYASGTNHTLPTNGFARSYSGLNMDAFLKKITFQQLSSTGIQSLGPTVEVLAEAEKLQGHRNAVTLRLKQLANKMKEVKP
ncbi:MAG: histidinol dehydrogenase [Bacteroidales bacterium]